jgi:hypothetical protein
MLISLMLASLFVMQPADAASPAIKVKNGLFFSTLLNDGKLQIRPTNRIPFIPKASCYEWLLQVEAEPKTVSIREVFELPAPAKSWPTQEGLKVASDRQSSTTMISDDISDGMIGHGWCVAEGDPLGPHDIRVYDGERLLHHFTFEVFDQTV